MDKNAGVMPSTKYSHFSVSPPKSPKCRGSIKPLNCDQNPWVRGSCTRVNAPVAALASTLAVLSKCPCRLPVKATLALAVPQRCSDA